jgi:hypothetical protein
MTSRTQHLASALALALVVALFPAQDLAAKHRPLTMRRIAHMVKPMAAEPISLSVFATGLDNPRGLKFGRDGNLYVAEGGLGGTDSTDATQCEQVIPPVGPYTGSQTGGRISRIDPNGVRTTVTDALPSSQTSADLGFLVSGVADVAFIGDTMYALLAGAGCSHGVIDTVNGVVRVDQDGSATLIADLSAYQQAHPVANPPAGDFEPDGTWWNMIAVRGYLYAVEPNHGELVRISQSGRVRRVVDISASQGHVVPTAIAYHGNFFVGNLNTFPIVEGSSKVWKITPSGRLKLAADDLTTVVGLAFDHRKRLYVLENTTGPNENPTPGTGTIVRFDHNGSRETIVTGLFLPTAMTFGPDGDLYVSNVGFGPPPMGLGQVIRIHFGP